MPTVTASDRDSCVGLIFLLFKGTEEEAAFVNSKSDVSGWLFVSRSSSEESWQHFAGTNRKVWMIIVDLLTNAVLDVLLLLQLVVEIWLIK